MGKIEFVEVKGSIEVIDALQKNKFYVRTCGVLFTEKFGNKGNYCAPYSYSFNSKKTYHIILKVPKNSRATLIIGGKRIELPPGNQISLSNEKRLLNHSSSQLQLLSGHIWAGIKSFLGVKDKDFTQNITVGESRG